MAENEAKKTAFEVLNAVNVNEHTETKDTGKVKLTYLSWAWAWAEVKKRYPTASYEIIKFNGLPYVYDERTGFMVYTTVTIEDITHEMWLPVMDSHNVAMFAHAYEYQTPYKKIPIQAATMFDINKTIMRCLTKNLAMFGLGLYIYAGEDLPEDVIDEDKIDDQKKKQTKAQPKEQKKAEQPKAKVEQSQSEENQQESPELKAIKAKYQELINYCAENKLDIKKVCNDCGLSKQSKLADFEMALIYARSVVMTGGEV